MAPVIYADILFLYNFLINSLILVITAKLINSNINILKIAFGAGIGGIYSVLMFFPKTEIFYTLLLKLLILFGIFYLVFGGSSVHKVIKEFTVFMTVNFTLGGAVYALVFLTDFGVMMNGVVSGAEVYMELSPWIIFSGIGLTYFVLGFYHKARQKAVYEQSLIKRVEIGYKGKTAEVNMFLDTGCRLCDPVNDKPAIIVDLRYIKILLSEKELAVIEGNPHAEEVYGCGLRVLPVTTVNGRSVISGIVADYISIDNVKIKKVTVGLLSNAVGGNYSGIINPEILDGGDMVYEKNYPED